MEADSDWVNYGTPATNERSSEQQHSGDYSRKVVTDGNIGGIIQPISGMVIGKHYLLECYMYIVNTTGNIRFGFPGQLITTGVTGKWIKVSNVIQWMGNTALVIYTSAPAVATFYVDDGSIKEITELVTNGNMEADSDWDNQGSPAANVRSNEQAHSGIYSRKITLDGVGSYGGIISADAITFVVGKSYIVTGWAYNLDMSNGERLVMDCTQFSAVAFSIYPNQGVWTQWSKVVVATGTSGKILFYNWPTDVAEANKSYYVDDVSVYEVEYQDLSGQDNDGAPANIPVFTTDHDDNTNGATTPNGTGDNISISGVTNTGNKMTVTMWVKSTQTGTAKFLFDGSEVPELKRLAWAFHTQISGNMGIYDQGAWRQTGSNTPNDGSWHFIALVIDNLSADSYVDGVKGSLTATLASFDWSAIDVLRIASNYGGTGSYFAGDLSDFRIYENQALTLVQLEAIRLGTSQVVSGSITPVGALVPIPIFVVPLSGSITPVGALSITQPDWLLIDEILAWKGEWDAAYSYDIADTVLYKSTDGNEWHVFVSKIGHNVGNIPVSTAAAWRRLYQEKFL